MDKQTEELICRVVDGYAAAEEKMELEAMMKKDPAIREEVEMQNEATNSINSLGLRELQDDIDDQFWSGVYNRLERRAGWILIVIGYVLFFGYTLYELLTDPDISAVFRIGIGALIIGFGLMINGTIRNRMKQSKNDKYKGVIR